MDEKPPRGFGYRVGYAIGVVLTIGLIALGVVELVGWLV